MSTKKVFDSEQSNFIKLVDRFYLALSLTRTCATSCNILKGDITNGSLNQKEKDCLNVCFANIQRTQNSFLDKVKTTMDLPPADEEEGGDEDDE